MVDARIIKKDPITLSNLADVLVKLEKKGDLAGAQQKAKDFAVKFSKLNKAQESKLRSDLKDLEIPRFTEEHIAQIINIMPRDVVELRTIFAGSKTTITPENLTKIQNTLKAYEK